MKLKTQQSTLFWPLAPNIVLRRRSRTACFAYSLKRHKHPARTDIRVTGAPYIGLQGTVLREITGNIHNSKLLSPATSSNDVSSTTCFFYRIPVYPGRCDTGGAKNQKTLERVFQWRFAAFYLGCSGLITYSVTTLQRITCSREKCHGIRLGMTARGHCLHSFALPVYRLQHTWMVEQIWNSCINVWNILEILARMAITCCSNSLRVPDGWKVPTAVI